MDAFVSGALRYLERIEAEENPRIYLMFLWEIGGVLKKKIWDLSRLTNVLDVGERRSKINLNSIASLMEELLRRSVSSIDY